MEEQQPYYKRKGDKAQEGCLLILIASLTSAIGALIIVGLANILYYFVA